MRKLIVAASMPLVLFAFTNCSPPGESAQPSALSSPPLESKTCAAPLLKPEAPAVYDCATGKAATGLGEYGVNMANVAGGPVAANALSPYYSNTAGTNDNGRLRPVDQNYLSAQSKFCSRDMEVTMFSQIAIAFLRLTPQGDGVYTMLNRDVGSIGFGFVRGFKEGQAFRYGDVGSFVEFGGVTLTNIPGYNAAEAKPFTVGVEGMEIYARYDGVEFFRTRDHRTVAPGRAAFQTMAQTGLREFAVKHLAPKPTLSNLTNRIYDLREFGLRELQTTGSINAGSNVLTLPAGAGFKAGDSVIVEIGKEPGQGLRGTQGVGGTWPPLQFASEAAMNADTTRENATYASTGTDIYRTFNGIWYKQDPITVYYASKIVPTALMAKVTAVSADGRQLTLEKTAAATVTSANVYYDNSPALNAVMGTSTGNDFLPENVILFAPAGKYALGKEITLFGRKGWRFEGAGEEKTIFFSPKGADSAHLNVFQADDSVIRNLQWIGNAGDNYYGMGVYGYPGGVSFTLSKNGLAEDLIVRNVWQGAVGTSYAENTWARRIRYYQTDPFRTYIQWIFGWSDSNGGGCVDCEIHSRWMIPGFEAFRSTGTSFIRAYGENASVSNNSSGNFLFEDVYLVVKANSQFENSNVAFHYRNPLFNMNSNIDNSSGSDGLVQSGGKLKNVVAIQEGYFNNRFENMSGIVVNDKNANITIEGGYFKSPDYDPAINNNGSVAVNSEGQNTVVKGLRVVGTAAPMNYPGGNIAIKTGSVSDCVADLINAHGSPVTNCKTNAQAGPAEVPARPVRQGEACVLRWQ